MSIERINEIGQLINEAKSSGIPLQAIIDATLPELITVVQEKNPHLTYEESKEHALDYITKTILRSGHLI